MSRCIDAEKLEQRLRDFSDWCRDNRKDGVDLVLNCMLTVIPTADMQEIKHGRWIRATTYGSYICSICSAMDTDCDDYYGNHRVLDQQYCPDCGARLEAEE